ncbi:MAG: nicotinate phosphoribosyltransferase [Candidatus Micrarchaeaceae archaeon]
MGKALTTDLYQLTMMQAFWKADYNPYATFDYFARSMPFGSYVIVAGLEYVLDYIKELRFENDDIAFLKSQGFERDFLNYLEGFRFTGDVYAMLEGSIAFQNEPMVTVKAPIMEAQLIETYLLNKMNFSTLIATKASRVAYAAGGKPVVEFGLRRAHGEGYLEATRAAYIGGCQSTSNVMAGKLFGIPVAGTMAHSFVMSFDTELDAFRAYASAYPGKSMLLIDTYDTIGGAKNAIKIAKELEAKGKKLIGIRIDSGDLLKLSSKVRKMLDDAGLNYVKIMASGDLNEWRIRDLLKSNAPIDMFGVGTELVTGQPKAALGGIYKLSEIRKNGVSKPKMKITDDAAKSTIPGSKSVWRIIEGEKFKKDVIALESEEFDGLKMLVKVVENGKVILRRESLDKIRRRVKKSFEMLPESYKSIDNAISYPIELSPKLLELKNGLEKTIYGKMRTKD